MKYIITENKLYKVIYDYLNQTFKEGDMYWEWADGYDELIAGFVVKPTVDSDYTTLFEYIKLEYYEGLLSNGVKDYNHLLSLAPIITFGEVDDSNFQEKMDNFFGNNWKPVFEEWFSNTYGDMFPVKTFIYN